MQSEAKVTYVYVVDDDEAVRDSTRVVLESYGMSVRTFGSAQDFLASVDDEPTGCLLLDQHMPEMTGLEMLEVLKASRKTLPVIMITARGDATFKDRAYRAGAVALLNKPVADDDLVRAIDTALLH
ncbi:MAG: response regulator [Rhodospirillaceae bacterium]|nr:response regulator [Rhodospirillaceae bacterium]